MTRTIRLGALALGLVIAVTAPAATLREVVTFEPTPVPIPSDLTKASATRAIARAFVMRSWRVTEINQDAGYVDAEYPIRVHVARVRARMGDGTVTFHYRESEKIDHGWKVRKEKRVGERDAFSGVDGGWALAESAKGPNSAFMVHPKYLEWVENVSRTLEGTLKLETLP